MSPGVLNFGGCLDMLLSSLLKCNPIICLFFLGIECHQVIEIPSYLFMYSWFYLFLDRGLRYISKYVFVNYIDLYSPFYICFQLSTFPFNLYGLQLKLFWSRYSEVVMVVDLFILYLLFRVINSIPKKLIEF